MAWYREQTAWAEPHSNDDPIVTTPALRAWLLAMIELHPPLNGPFAPSEPREGSRQADYSVGKHVIYVGFGWSQAEEAYEAASRLAGDHRVGLFDVSSIEGRVWLPGDGAELVLAHEDPTRPTPTGPLFQVRIPYVENGRRYLSSISVNAASAEQAEERALAWAVEHLERHEKWILRDEVVVEQVDPV